MSLAVLNNDWFHFRTAPATGLDNFPPKVRQRYGLSAEHA